MRQQGGWTRRESKSSRLPAISRDSCALLLMWDRVGQGCLKQRTKDGFPLLLWIDRVSRHEGQSNENGARISRRRCTVEVGRRPSCPQKRDSMQPLRGAGLDGGLLAYPLCGFKG